jgi:DNA segregation ATPase FtsK/SpoIIIE-like protein
MRLFRVRSERKKRGSAMNDDELKELEPLYMQAVQFAQDSDSMSISKLQRHFTIGYNRAARIIERLAADGVLTFNNMTGAYRRTSGNGKEPQQ